MALLRWTLALLALDLAVVICQTQSQPNDPGLTDWLSGLTGIFDAGNDATGRMPLLESALAGAQRLLPGNGRAVQTLVSNTWNQLQGQGQGLAPGVNFADVDLQSLLGLGDILRAGPPLPQGQGPVVVTPEGQGGPQMSQGLTDTSAQNAIGLGAGLDGPSTGQSGSLDGPGSGSGLLGGSLSRTRLPSLITSSPARRFGSSPALSGTSGTRRSGLSSLLSLFPKGTQEVVQQAGAVLDSPVVLGHLEGLLQVIPGGQQQVGDVNNLLQGLSGLNGVTGGLQGLAAASSTGRWTTFVPPGVQVSSWKRPAGSESVQETGFVWDSLMATVAVVRSVDPGLTKANYTQAATLYDFGDVDAMVAVRTGLSGAQDACYLLPPDTFTVAEVQAVLDSRNGTTMSPPLVELHMRATSAPLGSRDKNDVFRTYPSLQIFCDGVNVVRAVPSIVDQQNVGETEQIVKLFTLESELNLLVSKAVPKATEPSNGSLPSHGQLHTLANNVRILLG